MLPIFFFVPSYNFCFFSVQQYFFNVIHTIEVSQNHIVHMNIVRCKSSDTLL